MRAESSKTFLRFHVSLAIVFSTAALLCNSSLASPSEMIARAVATSGVPSVSDARGSEFTNAFSSVVIRVRNEQLPSYVSAAVTLRPDLARKIVASALKSRNSNDRPRCALIGQVVKAAIAAAPDAKRAIAYAAFEMCPWARECILAAAEIDGNDTAFFSARSLYNATFGALNPNNIFIGDVANTQSPEQPPAP